MNASIKIAVLLLWVTGAAYIQEDAHQKVRHHPVLNPGPLPTYQLQDSPDSTTRATGKDFEQKKDPERPM